MIIFDVNCRFFWNLYATLNSTTDNKLIQCVVITQFWIKDIFNLSKFEEALSLFHGEKNWIALTNQASKRPKFMQPNGQKSIRVGKSIF